MVGELLVEQPERVREALGGEDLERPVRAGVAREMRGALAAAVDDEDGARPGGRAEVRLAAWATWCAT